MKPPVSDVELYAAEQAAESAERNGTMRLPETPSMEIDTRAGQGIVIGAVALPVIVPLVIAELGPVAVAKFMAMSPATRGKVMAKMMELTVNNLSWPSPGAPSGTGIPRYQQPPPKTPSPIVRMKD